MSYTYGSYIPYNDQRCHRCGFYLVDHDPIGCPQGDHMSLTWTEYEEPKEPSPLRRLVHRFWVWRMQNPKHHTLVVEDEWEEGNGNWGSLPFSAYILHPDECYLIDNWTEPRWWDPMMVPCCGMDDFLDTVEPNDWPDPPFRTEVTVRSEAIRGRDFVEHDVWLEPLHGWGSE